MDVGLRVSPWIRNGTPKKGVLYYHSFMRKDNSYMLQEHSANIWKIYIK